MGYQPPPPFQNLVLLLQSCKEPSEIRQVHGFMIKAGFDIVPFLLSKLLANSIHDTNYAAKIFKYIKSPNLFMFNTMLRSYSISDDPRRALVHFNQMRAHDLLLDQFSFVSALKSCSRVQASWAGLSVHSVLLRTGFVLFLKVMNSLLHFYCESGWIGGAHQLFDEFPLKRDSVSWNTLMGGYLCVQKYGVVLDLFKQLRRDGIDVSVTTVLSISSAIRESSGSVLAESIHGYCIRSGFSMNLNVGTALVSMYGKTGSIHSARKVFDETAAKDIVMWNSLIYGYAKSGILGEAFRLLRSMMLHGVIPNSSTFVGLLSSSNPSVGLSVGRFVHDYIKEQQVPLDANLGTSLIEMYTKCGLLKQAVEVFENIERKDSICWTSMIFAYGLHGQADKAISLFHRMEEEGCGPNKVTFLAVLSACRHAGLVAEGKSFFQKMVEKYSFSPKVEHYGCVIDLFGRTGLLEEAKRAANSLQVKDNDATVWRTLLAACRVYGNVSLGEEVKRELERRFDEHPADSVTLVGAYAIAGRMGDHAIMCQKNPVEGQKCSIIGKKEVGFSRII